MTSKEKYRELCDKEKTIPIFSRSWWLDAVCGEENWDVLLVEKGGKIIASMPYTTTKNKIFKGISMPLLTQKNGIWICYPDNQKYTSKLSYEKDIINEIINKIEVLKLDFYVQNYDYTFTNWLPFYWKQYNQSTRYTYVIDDLSNIDRVYQETDGKVKTQIRKSEKVVSVKEDCSIETFYKMIFLTFKRQNMSMPYSFELIERIDMACKENRCRKILYAEDLQGRIHAAIYLVWDDTSMYYLMGGADPELRNSEATTLLLWNAIKFASTVVKKFDFEGSMIEPIERFFRAFGSTQKPYYKIWKDYSKLYKLSNIAKQLGKVIIKNR
ncbi:GNAT family N-acetyltransferase [Clostridium sp. YIM B02515]|uniref:GNAT family N-acetyltransferase n=1 Tax=Clostridium rhizosphaerae TaxID=2803861 RepID=A0ABS1TFH0_9CLOT|nr:GNAT family N-acetyltransferase [Clostridium rhizosphaerae]MBL4938129.1 GNAT family N-acetyltransferase [Clostridium rhizosphaerae]